MQTFWMAAESQKHKDDYILQLDANGNQQSMEATVPARRWTEQLILQFESMLETVNYEM